MLNSQCLLLPSPESFFFQSSTENSVIKIYGTIILTVVVYGFETWSFKLKEDNGPRMFGNRVLRKIFRPKRNGVREE